MRNLLLGNPAKSPPSKLFFCKVTRFYASSNTIDVVTIDDNVALLGCQILCSLPAGFSFGQRYMPMHDDSSVETEYVMSPGDIYCVAAYLNADYYNSVVLGFLFPKETVLSLPDYGLYIFRHESDVMWMVRGDGTAQMYHPSGSIIKIGSDDSNEMSEDVMIPTKAASFQVQNADDYNENKASNLFINWYQGQKIILDSSGNLIVKTRDDSAIFTMTPDGSITFDSTSTFGINAPGQTINVTANQINLIKG